MGLNWHMDVSAAPPLPENYTMAIFRIFQEMLSNVGRHARASHLDIRIEADNNAIDVLVKDNGCGADMQAFDAPDAYGILGMRERVRHLGGRLEIQSQKGKGTVFCLHVQLPIFAV
jgi:signal transduction histidine kinase